MKKIEKLARKHHVIARLYAEYRYVKYMLHKDSNDGKKLDNAINDYAHEENQRNIKKLKKDALYSRIVYGTSYMEYFLYEFEKLNARGRQEYVGIAWLGAFWNKFNKGDTHLIFSDKELNYERFKNYYGRDVIKVTSADDKDRFKSFVTRHKRAIIKPLADHQGHGVRIIDEDSNLDKVYEEYIGSSSVGSCVLEEVIVQVDDMARFNPSSVNTIRFNTFYHNNVLHKIGAIIRMGRNGSCVDNACAGGIYATIDLKTGIVDSLGTSHKLESFFFHPDTGVQILGAQIPKWKELNSLVEEVVRVVPEQKQVGWDFALTDKGWVIVEGNDRPGIQWVFHNRGLRKEMQCVFDAYYEE
jgi:hypothetical protein